MTRREESILNRGAPSRNEERGGSGGRVGQYDNRIHDRSPLPNSRGQGGLHACSSSPRDCCYMKVGLDAVVTIAWNVSFLVASKDDAVQTVTAPTMVEGEIGVDKTTGAIPEALNIAEELGDVLAVHLEVGTMIMISVKGIVLEKKVQITLMPLVSNRIARAKDTATIKTILFFPFLLLKLLFKKNKK